MLFIERILWVIFSTLLFQSPPLESKIDILDKSSNLGIFSKMFTFKDFFFACWEEKVLRYFLKSVHSKHNDRDPFQ